MLQFQSSVSCEPSSIWFIGTLTAGPKAIINYWKLCNCHGRLTPPPRGARHHRPNIRCHQLPLDDGDAGGADGAGAVVDFADPRRLRETVISGSDPGVITIR